MVTVLDNDAPVANITAADPTTITEGADATFTVTLSSPAPAGGLPISVSVSQSGSYIAGSAPTAAVIFSGQTTGTLTVSTDDDSLDETDGSITARINMGTRYTVGTMSTAMVTVLDDDAPDVNEAPTFDNSPLLTTINVAENTIAVGAGNLFAATDPDATDTTVTYSVDGIDAASFAISTTGTLTFNNAPDFENPEGGLKTTPTPTKSLSSLPAVPVDAS